MAPFPPSILISFFESATFSLNRHPDTSYCDRMGTGSIDLPPSLDAQRKALLKIQVQSLEEAISQYNGDRDPGTDAISLEEAQESLKSSQFAVARGMEDAARCALARAVLQAELRWDNWVRQQDSVKDEERSRGLKDEHNIDSMSADSIKEFCGLCSAAVYLPQIEEYLANGKDISFGDTMVDANGVDGQVDSGPSTLTPPERMEYIHLLLLRAVGYRAAFAKASMQKMFFPDEEEDGNDLEGPDAELREAFGNFLTATATAANKAATVSPPSSQISALSDGHTRVISVQHSERTVSGEAAGGMLAVTKDAGPLAQSMKEHDDERQRKQLAMARQAAVLQQGLLNELHGMGDIDREKLLADAEHAHLSFLKKVSELPIGEERLHYLQSIDSNTQRLLAIHKLWGAQSS